MRCTISTSSFSFLSRLAGSLDGVALERLSTAFSVVVEGFEVETGLLIFKGLGAGAGTGDAGA